MSSKKFALLLVTFSIAGALIAGPASGAAATATFVRADASTQGNWQGTYGLGGYVIPDTNTNQIPTYVTVQPVDQGNWIWTSDGTEVRDLQVPSNGATSARQASCWYTSSGNSYNVVLNFSDSNTHQVALYLLDWDYRGRSETIQVSDTASNSVLDSRSVSNFTNGIYLIWNISGKATITVTLTGGWNAVVSGIFFDAPGKVNAATPTATAAFIASDTATQGNWRKVYGSDGYSIANVAQTAPSYATASVENQLNWTWTSSTADPRALQVGSSRTATTWYNNTNFILDINFTDNNSHQLALYAVDWDARERSETVQLQDANTKTVLDSRNISSFTNGIYLVWKISGHVTITITCVGGVNAVISGAFFGGPGSAATPPSSPTSGTTPPTSAPTTDPAPTPTAVVQGQLSFSPSQFSFGSVNVGNSSAQAFTVSNIGSGTITLSNVVISGSGFNATGVSSGVTLASGQSSTMNVTFVPAESGTFKGSVAFTSNAKNSSASIGLSGTGVQPAPTTHSVTLSWGSSSSSIVGYDVYRGTTSSGPFTLLTASPVSTTSYTDTTAQSGQTYYYVVTAVDASGDQSSYSNVATATIP